MVTTNELFSLSNQMADYVAQNEEGFRRYLITAAHARHYTVSNQLLIQSYMYARNGETATEVRDPVQWNKDGIQINSGEYPIYVMEYAPGQKMTYTPREVYDISQTDAAGFSVPEPSALTDAVLLSSPVKIEFKDTLDIKGKKSIYSPETESIGVTRGFKSFDEIIKSVTMEYAHYYFHQRDKKAGNEYKRAVYNNASYAASFIVASAYKLDVSDYRFDHMPALLGKYETKDIKERLKDMSETANMIMNAADRQLERMYAKEERGM